MAMIIRKLYHVITLTIILYTRRKTTLCGNSNALFHMKDYILRLTLVIMTKDLDTMLWITTTYPLTVIIEGDTTTYALCVDDSQEKGE